MVDSEQLIQERIQDLRENTDFVSALFDHLVGYAIIAADFDGNVLAYNEGARLIYGYAPEEIISQQKFEILFPSNFVEAGELANAIADLIDNKTLSYEGEKINKNGDSFPAQISFTLTKDKYGKVVGFIEIVQDLTERRQAEAAAAAAEANAARIEQLERELHSLERFTTPSKVSVTAQMYGGAPLRELAPEEFDEFVIGYQDLMDLALEHRVHRVEHSISARLREMSERLGFLRAGPRDVVEIHKSAAENATEQVPSVKAQALIEEARLILLELMGYLVSYYRIHAVGAGQQARRK